MEYFDWSPKKISINICIFYNFANSIVLWQCSLGHAGKALKIVAYKLKELQRSWLHRPLGDHRISPAESAFRNAISHICGPQSQALVAMTCNFLLLPRGTRLDIIKRGCWGAGDLRVACTNISIAVNGVNNFAGQTLARIWPWMRD